MLKTPIIYREQKKVVKCVLNSFFKENTKDRGNISSSDFHNASQLKNWNKSGLGIYGLLKFRSKNILSATLRFITRGHIQLFNKYQTEEQERLLYRDFHKDLKDATEKFAKLGLMTRQQKKQWDKLPLRSAGVSERYHLISLAQIVDA